VSAFVACSRQSPRVSTRRSRAVLRDDLNRDGMPSSVDKRRGDGGRRPYNARMSIASTVRDSRATFPVRDVLLAGLVLLCALCAGCAAPTDTGMRRGKIELAECRLKDVPGTAWCGDWTVPENHDQPEGRKIGLRVSILPAYIRTRAPDPLLLLAGGPGQAASDIGKLALIFDAVRRSRDIVLIDQRGSGRSHPFACKLFDTLDPVVAMMQVSPDTAKLKACVAAFDGDPRFYTTNDYLRDLESVREALGAEQFNLWGGSYGSRVALAYLRVHPERIRSAILDGVAPTSMRIIEEALANGETRLRQTMTDCAATAACQAAYPRLAEAWAQLERDFAEPRNVTMIHPRTGEPQSVDVDFLAIDGALRTLLYSAEYSAMVPALIDRAAAGDLGPLFASSLRVAGDLGQGMNMGLQLSVVCAEDAQRSPDGSSAPAAAVPAAAVPAAVVPAAVVPAAAAPVTAVSPSDPAPAGAPTSPDSATASAATGANRSAVAATVLARLAEGCAYWPRGKVADEFHQPTAVDKPVLIFSGGLDPVTPAANGELAARTLPHATHVVAPGYGHLVSPFSCAPRMVVRFVEDGNTDRLQDDCLRALRASKRPPFFVNRLEIKP